MCQLQFSFVTPGVTGQIERFVRGRRREEVVPREAPTEMACLEHRGTPRSVWHGSWDWDVVTVRGEQDAAASVDSVALSECGQWLAAATSYGVGDVEIWELCCTGTRKPVVRRLREPEVQDHLRVEGMCWVGSRLVCAYGDGHVRIWDIDKAEPLSIAVSLASSLPRAVAGSGRTIVCTAIGGVSCARFDDSWTCLHVDHHLLTTTTDDSRADAVVTATEDILVVTPQWRLIVWRFVDEDMVVDDDTKWRRVADMDMTPHHAPPGFFPGKVPGQPRLTLLDGSTFALHGGRCIEVLLRQGEDVESLGILGVNELENERSSRDDASLAFRAVCLGDRHWPFDDPHHEKKKDAFFSSEPIPIRRQRIVFAIIGASVPKAYETTAARSIYAYDLDAPLTEPRILFESRVLSHLEKNNNAEVHIPMNDDDDDETKKSADGDDGEARIVDRRRNFQIWDCSSLARRRAIRTLTFRRCPRVRHWTGAAQLLAVDTSGLLHETSVGLKTRWPGPYFPVSYEQCENNTTYEEREDEFDFVGKKKECVPARFHDIYPSDGFKAKDGSAKNPMIVNVLAVRDPPPAFRGPEPVLSTTKGSPAFGGTAGQRDRIAYLIKTARDLMSTGAILTQVDDDDVDYGEPQMNQDDDDDDDGGDDQAENVDDDGDDFDDAFDFDLDGDDVGDDDDDDDDDDDSDSDDDDDSDDDSDDDKEGSDDDDADDEDDTDQ